MHMHAQAQAHTKNKGRVQLKTIHKAAPETIE
jgi:hypothetical protein